MQKSAAPPQGMPADTDHKQQSKQLQNGLSMPSVQGIHCSAALSSNKMKVNENKQAAMSALQQQAWLSVKHMKDCLTCLVHHAHQAVAA